MTAPLVVISSPKAGAGKTTLAFNLATALLRDGYKVGVYSSAAAEFMQKRSVLLLQNPTMKNIQNISKQNIFNGDFADCTVALGR